MSVQCGRCGEAVYGHTSYDREQALLAHQRLMHSHRGMRVPSDQTTLDGGLVA